ncbi:MAG: peptidase M19 [Akkermansiaceae bacterium]|nr:peptidase M19 [Akkermansiaceae bacterium]
MKLIFDAHLDLSLNAIDYNRDLRWELDAIRAEEEGMSDLKGRGCGTVCFPEMRRGGVGMCVATLIAGCMKPGAVASGWNSPENAWAQTQGQLAWYRAMEEGGELEAIVDRTSLERICQRWSSGQHEGPIGYVLSLEGADSIRTPAHLEAAYEQGLRAIGPAHYGVGRYALGHDQEGPLSAEGRELVAEMDRLGFILDATHLCDRTFHDVLDLFEGPVWASHSNCRALVDNPRQFSDEQIKRLIERGAVIGGALDTWMMIPGWERGVSTPAETGIVLDHLLDHTDHICQLAGNADHVGIGSDLDGGFGTEQSPGDLDSIADLARFDSLLEARGYSPEDIDRILNGNFFRFLQLHLPA